MLRCSIAALGLLAAGGTAVSADAGSGTVGVLFHAGVPDGLQAGLAWRATPRLRFEGGAGHNGVTYGVRAGVSASLVPAWITPSFAVEAGHFFQGDANPMARRLTGDPDFHEPLMSDIGYDFASARAGLELGYRRATVSLHAGIGAIRARVGKSAFADRAGDMVEVRRDPIVRAIGPSARVGMVIYF